LHDAQRSAATLPLGNPLLSVLSIKNFIGLKKNRVCEGRPLNRLGGLAGMSAALGRKGILCDVDLKYLYYTSHFK
jgi:hypothetical protein